MKYLQFRVFRVTEMRNSLDKASETEESPEVFSMREISSSSREGLNAKL